MGFSDGEAAEVFVALDLNHDGNVARKEFMAFVESYQWKNEEVGGRARAGRAAPPTRREKGRVEGEEDWRQRLPKR